MGTSGAYGGTPGWQGVSDQTQEWIEDRPGAGGGGQVPDVSDTPVQPAARTRLPSRSSRVIGTLGKQLSREIGSGTGRRGGGGTRGRSVRQATTSGSRAATGVYGLRTGDTGALAELGLTLDELAGLSQAEQAQRIVDAAAGPTGSVDASEARLANANVVWWAITQEVEPTPLEIASRWVVEYVWQVWISEAGPTITKFAKDGRDRLQIEEEFRSVLEAVVSAQGLPDDRPIRATDFQRAINDALTKLARIGDTDT